MTFLIFSNSLKIEKRNNIIINEIYLKEGKIKIGKLIHVILKDKDGKFNIQLPRIETLLELKNSIVRSLDLIFPVFFSGTYSSRDDYLLSVHISQNYLGNPEPYPQESYYNV